MAARKGKAVTKRASTDVASIQEQLRKQAEQMNDAVGAIAGNRIRVTQSKRFRDSDGNDTEGPIYVVVLDFNSMNAYYDKDYDKDNIESPVCFALNEPASLGGRIDTMKPSDNAQEKQSEDCKSCPMNAFGTDARGKGKACQNRRVLVCINPEIDPDEGALQILSVSPGAISRWDAHVRTLASRGLTPICVVTEVSFDPGVDYPSLMFKASEENQHLASHFARQAEARDLLKQEPMLTPVSNSDTPSNRPKRAPAAAAKRGARRTA